jgi:hypothetical protein
MGYKLVDFIYQGHLEGLKFILFFKCMSEETIDSHPTKTKHPKIIEAAETVDDKIMKVAETLDDKIKDTDEEKDARGVRIR